MDVLLLLQSRIPARGSRRDLSLSAIFPWHLISLPSWSSWFHPIRIPCLGTNDSGLFSGVIALLCVELIYFYYSDIPRYGTYTFSLGVHYWQYWYDWNLSGIQECYVSLYLITRIQYSPGVLKCDVRNSPRDIVSYEDRLPHIVSYAE